MSNPWEKIDLNDYESHMSLDSVCQLQALNQMMKEQFEAYEISSVMILGIAGGNGLEHIDQNRIKKVYGVDVNRDFLAECEKRYAHLEGTFEAVCADLLSADLQLPSAELVVANLLVEYIGYECFEKVIGQVKPKYVSCIIQINTGDSFVSDSPYLHSFDCLEEVHHQMEETALTESMQRIGYVPGKILLRELPNGKKFIRLDFEKG
ncbi:MAG: class I SAM-dependent methyltransferase [Lachnospiraceae bacterium]|nr:class I SAM-dependent methyltransferase [Lachnospiraceae bacterium]